MTDAAEALGLTYARGKFGGTVDGIHVTLREVVASGVSEGVEITAQAKTPFAGELRISGPSENAGTGTPEVKLKIGRGAFDYRFWIARSKPRDFAKELLAPLEEAQDAMQAAPFGQWTVKGTIVGYASSNVPESAAQVKQIVRALVGIAQQAT